MATFSTKAASALNKVLKRSTLVKIQGVLRSLEQDLDNEVARTAGIEHEADRVLDIEYDLSGQEIIDRGRLVHNLTSNLDGPSLTRAISTATSAYNTLKAERDAWVQAEKTKWEAGHLTEHIRFQEDTHHGPGVIIPPLPYKP